MKFNQRNLIILFASFLIAIVFSLSPRFLSPLSVTAQTSKIPTPTPSKTVIPVSNKATLTPVATITPAVTKSDNGKYQEIRQTIKDIASQIKDKMEKRSYVGVIREITTDIIIITNFRGQQRIITDETTIFLASNNKEIRIKDLAVGDKLIALGVSPNDDELQAVRVNVVAPVKTVPPSRLVLIGRVIQADTAKATLTFANEGSEASTKSYKIVKNSKYSPAPQEPLITVTAKLITANKRAILVYQEINKVLTLKTLFYLE